MTLRDLVSISAGNLWRMKLRSFLTISGVTIAIAAFVAMLSFGAGNQARIEEQFNELGLFSTMHVYPPDSDSLSDSLPPAVLDQQAVEKFMTVPGVNLAYPLEAFAVTATLGDSSKTTRAQALPQAAARTQIFSHLLAGTSFSSDSAKEAMVTDDFLEEFGLSEADSVIGRSIAVSVQVAVIDSGLHEVIRGVGDRIGERARQMDFDSIRSAEFRQRLVREELQGAMMRFMDGYLSKRAVIAETLTVTGVLESRGGRRLRIEPVVIPTVTAIGFRGAGFTGNAEDLLSAIGSGNPLFPETDTASHTYPRVTIDLDPHVLYENVRDSIEAMGYRTFSFAEQFDQIRQFFFYFDMALGLIGLIALITASLGIVNTMVMSIIERKREIGVLKSLGADERQIRFLFLVESAAIGTIGAVAGIVFGWLISRLGSTIAKTIMEDQGVDPVELFALPLWLVLIAFGFGLIVSLVAGYYPASRAARVDPVEALRNE